MDMRWSVLFFFASLSLVVPMTTQAQSGSSQLGVVDARLESLRRSEREALSPLLARGPIAFVGFSGDHELPAVVLATEVEGSPDCIMDVLGSPERYPRFMSALQSTQIRHQDEQEVSYDWTWQLGFLRLRGRSSLTRFSSQRSADQRRSRLLAMQNVGGDLGRGRMLWRAYPLEGERSLLVFSSRIDMRASNYLTRQMSSAGNSINRSVNISLAFMMMMSVRDEVARMRGATPRVAQSLPALVEPQLELTALAPLLARGDLVSLDESSESTQQLLVLSRTWRSPSVVWPVMTNPDVFGRALVQGSRARVIERSDTGATFEWSIPIPMVGSEGRMRLEHRPGVVHVDGLSGHLSESAWRFRLHRLPWGEAAIVGWSRFDPADASWMLATLIEDTPYLRGGIAVAGKVMIVRSLRSRLRTL
jgi:hypothetical protein